MTDETALGPVDYLIVEWPAGKEPTGEGLAILGDLTDRGLIRVLDLAFVRKEEDGSVSGLALADIDGDGELDLTIFEGVSSGLLDSTDVAKAGEVIEPGSSAGLLIYENSWAAPFVAALRRGGAQLVSAGFIPMDDLLASLDASES